jgi:hypothetical protein
LCSSLSSISIDHHSDDDDDDLTCTIRNRFEESVGGQQPSLTRGVLGNQQTAKQSNYLLLGRPVAMQARLADLIIDMAIIKLFRKEMDEEEQLRIDRLKLAPAPELYFGRGLG